MQTTEQTTYQNHFLMAARAFGPNSMLNNLIGFIVKEILPIGGARYGEWFGLSRAEPTMFCFWSAMATGTMSTSIRTTALHSYLPDSPFANSLTLKAPSGSSGSNSITDEVSYLSPYQLFFLGLFSVYFLWYFDVNWDIFFVIATSSIISIKSIC